MSSSDRSVKRVKRSSNEEYNTLLECLDAIKHDDANLFLVSFKKLKPFSSITNEIVRFVFMCTNNAFAIALIDNKVRFRSNYALVGISTVGNIALMDYYTPNYFDDDIVFQILWHAIKCKQIDYLRHIAALDVFTDEVIISCIRHIPSLAIELLQRPDIVISNFACKTFLRFAVAQNNPDVMKCIFDCRYPLTIDSVYDYLDAFCQFKMYKSAIECIASTSALYQIECNLNEMYNIASSTRAYPVMVFLIKNSPDWLSISTTYYPKNIQVLQALYVYKYIGVNKCRGLITAMPEWCHIATNMVLLQSAFGVPVEITRFIRKFLY